MKSLIILLILGNKSIDDEVYISLIDVYEETPDTGGSGNGGSSGSDGDSDPGKSKSNNKLVAPCCSSA